jgi:N utilization substance protein B
MSEVARPRGDRSARARSLARRLVLQALYQWQLTGHSFAELRNQYATDEGYPEVDPEYFQLLLQGILDPVEHAVLLIGLEELRAHVEVPYRVVLNECVELAKKFGATDGHKFINAVLDRAARQLRAAEQQAQPRRTPRK